MSLLAALVSAVDAATARVRSLSRSLLSAFPGHLVSQDRDDVPTAIQDGRRSSRATPPSSADPWRERRLGIQLMWEDGYAMAEIAETMEMTTSQLGNEMKRMRIAGWDLPRRRGQATT